jgi:hypothetical protein
MRIDNVKSLSISFLPFLWKCQFPLQNASTSVRIKIRNRVSTVLNGLQGRWTIRLERFSLGTDRWNVCTEYFSLWMERWVLWTLFGVVVRFMVCISILLSYLSAMMCIQVWTMHGICYKWFNEIKYRTKKYVDVFKSTPRPTSLLSYQNKHQTPKQQKPTNK